MYPRVLLQIPPLAVSALVAACDSTPTGPDREPVFILVIHPSSSILQTGRQLQLKVTAKGAEDRVRSPVDVHWSSTDDGIAKVTAGGLVVAGNHGTAQIRASWKGHEGWASVQVIDRDTPSLCPVFSVEGLQPSAEEAIPCTPLPSTGEER